MHDWLRRLLHPETKGGACERCAKLERRNDELKDLLIAIFQGRMTMAGIRHQIALTLRLDDDEARELRGLRPKKKHSVFTRL